VLPDVVEELEEARVPLDDGTASVEPCERRRVGPVRLEIVSTVLDRVDELVREDMRVRLEVHRDAAVDDRDRLGVVRVGRHQWATTSSIAASMLVAPAG
jgi:hypothetical protein